MTVQDLIDEIRERVDEPAPSAGEDSYFVDTRIITMINQAHRFIIKKTGCIYRMTNYYDTGASTYRNAMASTSGSASHYLPDDFLRIHKKLGIWWDQDDGHVLKPMNKLALERDLGIWRGITQSGTIPRYYEIRQSDQDSEDYDSSSNGKLINVYPYPGAAGNLLQVHYIPKVDNMTVSDEPVFDDEDYQMIIVYDVAYRLKEKREKLKVADYYKAMRDEHISDMKAYYDNKYLEGRRHIHKSRGRSSRKSESVTVT